MKNCPTTTACTPSETQHMKRGAKSETCVCRSSANEPAKLFNTSNRISSLRCRMCNVRVCRNPELDAWNRFEPWNRSSCQWVAPVACVTPPKNHVRQQNVGQRPPRLRTSASNGAHKEKRHLCSCFLVVRLYVCMHACVQCCVRALLRLAKVVGGLASVSAMVLTSGSRVTQTVCSDKSVTGDACSYFLTMWSLVSPMF